MTVKQIKKDDVVGVEYFRIKELLKGKVPGRMDYFTYMGDEKAFICNEFKNSPFKHYRRYLNGLNGLAEETIIYNSIRNEFLKLL